MKIIRSAAALAVGGGLALGSLGAMSGVASASTTTAAAPAVASPTAAWPSIAQGRPDFKAGSNLGYYIWHDSAGWHLEVTHATHDHVVFSGYVVSDGAMHVRRVDDERNDIVRTGPEHHVLGFAFNNYGYLDGVHFWDAGTKLSFHLFVNGHPVMTSQINLGRYSASPLHDPFTLSRTAPSAS